MYKPLASPAYPKAPITEAVIEIRVANAVKTTTLNKIAKRLKTDYPKSEQIKELEVQVGNSASNVTARELPISLKLTSSDAANIIILRPSGITTARQPLYPGWDELSARARENWSAWRAESTPSEIRRVGVRFINRIDIPQSEDIKLEDYFNFLPNTEAVFECDLLDYVAQAVLKTHIEHWTARITTTPVRTQEVPNAASIILDIDVWREVNIPLRPDDMWKTIDEARGIKNDLFERSLTAQTKELFA